MKPHPHPDPDLDALCSRLTSEITFADLEVRARQAWVAEAARRLAETQADLAEARHRVAEARAILVRVDLTLQIQSKA